MINSLLHTLLKVARIGLLFVIPFLLTNYPEIYNLSIGAGLVALYDILKHTAKIRLP
jgi:hypothetical protein